MLQIDSLAYNNRLKHLPPAQKFWFALVMLVLALVSHYPIQIAILMWMSWWTTIYAGIPSKIYRAAISSVMVFLVMGLPALVFNYDPHSIRQLLPDRLWQVDLWGGQLYLSRAGTIEAIEMMLRSLSSTAALFFIVFTIPIVELVTIAKQLHCPSIIVELLLLVYRCIFLLLDTAQKIVTAQISRGGYRTHKLRMQSLNLLVHRLIQRVASRYQQLTLGATARSSSLEFRFWQPQEYRYSWRYAGESIVGFLVLAIGEILYRVYV